MHKRLTAFGNFVHNYHINIKNIQSDLCKLQSFSNSQEINTAGWRAENYLAFCRVMNYSFGFIYQFIGADFIQEKLSFEYLHHACLCMISRLMTTQKVSILELDNHIKVFLSLLDLCERVTFINDEAGMFWFRRSNFLCLLNLPHQIDRFGPLRKYWEGSRERYIQEIKPLMKHTRETTSFLKIQFEKLNKYSLLRNLCKSTQSNGNNLRTYDRFRQCSMYSNLSKVLELIRIGKPLSVIQESQYIRDVVYIVISGNNCVHLHEINFEDSSGQTIYNLWFTKVTVTEKFSLSLDNLQSIDFNIFNACICTSRLYETSYIYNCFSNDWLYREFDGKFKLPSIPKSLNMFVNQII